MGRPHKPRHILHRRCNCIFLQIPGGLVCCDAAVSPAVEFAELLAAVRRDIWSPRTWLRGPYICGRHAVYSAALYLAGAGDDGEASARCRRADMAGTLIFRAGREPGFLLGIE